MSKSLHEQNSIDNKNMAKFKAKPKHKHILIFSRRWDGVSPEEVLERLAKVGIHRNIRTLQRYAKMGLIPKSEIKNLGRGKGKIADFPDVTPSEMYASLKLLMNFSQLTMEDVAKLRKIALMCGKDIDFNVLMDILKKLPESELPKSGPEAAELIKEVMFFFTLWIQNYWTYKQHEHKDVKAPASIDNLDNFYSSLLPGFKNEYIDILRKIELD